MLLACSRGAQCDYKFNSHRDAKCRKNRCRGEAQVLVATLPDILKLLYNAMWPPPSDAFPCVHLALASWPPWPNGQGVGLLIRRLRVRVPQGVLLFRKAHAQAESNLRPRWRSLCSGILPSCTDKASRWQERLPGHIPAYLLRDAGLPPNTHHHVSTRRIAPKSRLPYEVHSLTAKLPWSARFSSAEWRSG